MKRAAPKALADLPSNAVRPLGALEAPALAKLAEAAGHRWVHVPLAGCTDKKSVLRALGRAFMLPDWFGANLDALYDSLTDLPERGAAPGYVVVLEGMTKPVQFDAEQREALLDVFRDAAEAFADRGIALRVFYR